MLHLVRSIFSPILDFIYPPGCLSCDRLLSNGRDKICVSCWESIQPVSRELPLYKETRAKLLESGDVTDLVSCFVFEKKGAFQHVAHALKYQGYESLGIELGKRLGKVMQEWGIQADLLVPIPLHKIRMRERGYNQAELIARGVSARTNIPVGANTIRRRKNTQTQTKLSLEMRHENMESAFEVSSQMLPALNGKTCVLVDDVITTGATILSCARILRKSGALHIVAASSALADKHVDV